MSGAHDYADKKAEQATERAYAHVGVVTSAPEKTDKTPTQLVEVAGETFIGTETAEVVVPEEGDTNLPSEGARVLVTFVGGEHPVVIGQLYSPASGGRTTAPPYETRDRRLGHSETNAHARIEPDGTVVVEAADGTNITLSSDGSAAVEAADGTNITLSSDGGAAVEAADGTDVSVQPNGTVSVDGGDTGVVTDVSTSTDGDGHVTDISITRSDTLFV